MDDRGTRLATTFAEVARAAFELLRDASKRLNIELVQVAHQVIHPTDPEISFGGTPSEAGNDSLALQLVVLDVPGTLPSPEGSPR